MVRFIAGEGFKGDFLYAAECSAEAIRADLMSWEGASVYNLLFLLAFWKKEKKQMHVYTYSAIRDDNVRRQQSCLSIN